MPRVVALEGKVFGRLTIIKRLQERRDGSVLWQCHCACGNEIQVNTRHLNRAKHTVRSCGCLKKLSGKDHKDWKGVGEISGKWWCAHVAREFKQKSRAAIAIEISREYAWELFIEQDGRCALSKIPLVLSNRFSCNTASLDRIDSTQGYIVGNVQWLHKDINMMKRTYNQEYFVELCGLVKDNTTMITGQAGMCPIR